jgi:hypothetical protein
MPWQPVESKKQNAKIAEMARVRQIDYCHECFGKGKILRVAVQRNANFQLPEGLTFSYLHRDGSGMSAEWWEPCPACASENAEIER